MINLVALGVACVVLKARPSTIIRLGEDGLINGARGIANRVRSAKVAVRREYRARMLAAATQQLERDLVTMRNLSPAQRDALVKDENMIRARADEIREQREGKARRSSSVGRQASL